MLHLPLTALVTTQKEDIGILKQIEKNLCEAADLLQLLTVFLFWNLLALLQDLTVKSNCSSADRADTAVEEETFQNAPQTASRHQR